MGPVIFPNILYSGDPIPLNLTFYKSDRVSLKDLTGITVGCTVKANETDPDSEALFQEDIPGDTTGVINFLIPGQNSGQYFIDVKTWLTTQSNQRSTLFNTTFDVQQSITLRMVPS
jgi:hypothetical protein